MPRYEITRAGELLDEIEARHPKAALTIFAKSRGYEIARLSGNVSRSTLAVVGVGLFKAERIRGIEENVDDAARRRARATDDASREAWDKEAEARAAGADPIRHSARRRDEGRAR